MTTQTKKIIAPTEDFCAKILFENDIVRKFFICSVLNIPVENVKGTKLMNPIMYRLSKKDKEGILDVYAEMNDGTRVNIEIQVKRQDEWDKRNIYYLSRLYTKGLRSGKKYSDLKKCVSICILSENYLDGDKTHTKFLLRDEDGKVYTDVIQIHIIELKKLQDEKNQFIQNEKISKQVNKPHNDNTVEEWIRFFKCRTEEDVEMLLNKTKNQGIIEAIKELRLINASEYIRARYEAKLKAKRDRMGEDDYIRKEAINEERNKYTKLTKTLIDANRIEDLRKAMEDENYMKQLYQEFGIEDK